MSCQAVARTDNVSDTVQIVRTVTRLGTPGPGRTLGDDTMQSQQESPSTSRKDLGAVLSTCYGTPLAAVGVSVGDSFFSCAEHQHRGERCPCAHPARAATALYDKLERVIVPMFYGDQERFLQIMLHAIALNGSFFNTQRMMQQYVIKAYFL